MKFFLTLSFSLFIFISFSQFTNKELKEIGDSLKKYEKLKGEYDKHNGIIWVKKAGFLGKPVYTTATNIKFYLYFGIKKIDGEIIKTPIRIKTYYNASNWLFIDQISFALVGYKEGDEKLVQTIKLSCSEPTRTVISGAGIEEVCDVPLTTESFNFFKQMAFMKRMSTIRFTGKKYHESGILPKRLMVNAELFKCYEEQFNH